MAPDEAEQVRGRAVVAKKLRPILVEAVVRGYLIGSGWKDYQETGAVCGITLPAGLRQAEKLAAADLHARGQGRPAATTTKTSASPKWRSASAPNWRGR